MRKERMMGVYIKDMEKPKNCGECPLMRGSYCAITDNFYFGEADYDPTSCPIEEVDDIAFGLYKAYMDGIEEPKDNAISLLPSGELLVDTKYANEAKSVRLMDREGFTRVFEEQKKGHWIMHIDDLFPADSTQECSVCHEWQFINGNDDNYCPNCGAKMERSKE